MSESRPERRRTVLVNKPLQGRLMIDTSILPALGLVGLMTVVAFFCHRLSIEVDELGVELESVTPLLLSVTTFVAVAGVFLMFNGLKLSHRIAGPLYRICQSIKRIREGDVDFEVRLRPGDLLGEARDELNLLLGRLRRDQELGAIVLDADDGTAPPAGHEQPAPEEPVASGVGRDTPGAPAGTSGGGL